MVSYKQIILFGGDTMNAIGRIGIIMPEITDPLDYDVIRGVYSQAKELGYDVLIFTGIYNSHLEFQQDAYVYGMENIYELICKGKLDGILYAASYFNNKKVSERIYEFLKQTDTPCLVLGEENDELPYIFPPERESMRMITRHLADVHKFRRIYCVTGFKDHYESEERLKGFLDAVSEAGLSENECLTFYGGFWHDIPKQIAADIAAGNIPNPDAVVCASDVMACAMCEGLKENGFSVPEDIAVTGYDGSWGAYSHSPQITTVFGREYQLGAEGMLRLYSMMGGSREVKNDFCQGIRYGRSCGCKKCDNMYAAEGDTSLTEHIKVKIQRYTDRKAVLASNFIYYMSDRSTLEELIASIDKLGHLLSGWKWLDICLCSDWIFDFENPAAFRQHGFSDTTFLALSKRAPKNDRDQYSFPTEKLLPALDEPHEPLVLIFTSLHCEQQIFGYMATAYEDVNDICVDEYYVNWCNAVSNGLYNLQRNMYADYMKKQIAELSVHDPATGLFNKKGLLNKLPEFVRECRQMQKSYSLVMLSNICKEDISSQLVINESMLIANALRLSAKEGEISARLGDNIFAILLPYNNDETDSGQSEKRTIDLERSIQKLQGDIINPQLPELIVESVSIRNESIISISHIIEEMVKKVSEKSAAAASSFSDYKNQLYQLRRDIYLSPQEDWSISVILKRIGISRSHFQRIYKAQFSVSCMDDIIQARLEKAQQLLLYTDMRIQEIAEQCGYGNESHFMRQFKNKCGITASQFRKRSE